MNNQYKIVIQEKPWSLNVDIYILEKGYRTSLASVKDGYLEMTELKEGETEGKPTLIIPLEVWQILKREMIDNKVREKSEVEAELMATKYHLEDMRTLALPISQSINKIK